eukprot:TRINITY_DN6414_c0_g1_i2.p1 TRINITY_DN6414_c0_g1~~TRINITY_DN6414_c0_g1_i2.p1  ORF type:complete len:182 (+),score=14.77 TRINITY_DN6414_c0_g1_i2:151-696(+)
MGGSETSKPMSSNSHNLSYNPPTTTWGYHSGSGSHSSTYSTHSGTTKMQTRPYEQDRSSNQNQTVTLTSEQIKSFRSQISDTQSRLRELENMVDKLSTTFERMIAMQPNSTPPPKYSSTRSEPNQLNEFSKSISQPIALQNVISCSLTSLNNISCLNAFKTVLEQSPSLKVTSIRSRNGVS